MTSAPDRNRPVHPPADIDPATPPEQLRLVIGRIVGVHGLRGDLTMAIITDQPEIIPELTHVFLDDDPTPVPVESARPHRRQMLLRFAHITTRNDAELLRGTIVRVSPDQLLPQAEDSYFHYQILGLSVFTEIGDQIGTVVEIIETGEVDVYVVRSPDGADQLFPALREVVLEIDPAQRRMVVRPQEWERKKTGEE